jgi:ABC-type sugar transport system substrate-binding protein
MRKSAWWRLLAAATIVVAFAAAVGCGASSSSSGGDQPVGFSVLNARDPDLAVMTAAMKGQAAKDKVALSVADAKGDVSTELNSMENLVTKKPKAIIMMPIDAKASQAAAKQANQANIPLFILSTQFAPGSSVNYKSYIGVDDTQAGRMQADFLNKELPQGGNIIYIVGTYGASWTDRRKAGFMEVKNPNIHIATELQANGDRAEAKRITEDLLNKYPKGKIQALVAHNDEMAIGAAQAIKEAGRQNDIKIVLGVDGTKPGLTAIKDGEMTGTILQRSADQGTKAVQVVKDYLAGQKIAKAYNLPFKLVTKQNVQSFLNQAG